MGWLRPRQRVHPHQPRVGIRAAAVLHVDVTVIRLLDGTKVFLQAVMDNFSRKILSWRIGQALEPWRTGELLKTAVAELRKVGKRATNLLADSGIENVNIAVDVALLETGLERILAQVEVSWSNSMIEAFWRQAKHSWLFINRLDSFAAVERLVAFYIEQHNHVIPQYASVVEHLTKYLMARPSISLIDFARRIRLRSELVSKPIDDLLVTAVRWRQ